VVVDEPGDALPGEGAETFRPCLISERIATVTILNDMFTWPLPPRIGDRLSHEGEQVSTPAATSFAMTLKRKASSAALSVP
jgi:hypothetical protein